jgi:hypothetical protein
MVSEFRCAGNAIVQPPVNYTSIPFATLIRYWTQVTAAITSGLADVSQCALMRMPNEFMDVQQPMLRQVINTDLEPLYQPAACVLMSISSVYIMNAVPRCKS